MMDVKASIQFVEVMRQIEIGTTEEVTQNNKIEVELVLPFSTFSPLSPEVPAN